MNKQTLIGVIIAASVVLLGTVAYMMTRQQPAADNTTTIDDTSQVPTEDKTSNTQVHDSEVASAAKITYTDDGFSPSTLTVKKGSTITVKNDSSVDVMFSSADHPVHQQQPELNMKTLRPGESGTITVTKVGSWGYHDHIDESMTGMIIVTE
ncbi:MAG: hypothetical protein JWM07_619 [Candidatus Saccharibacteria bacterium]|jgi:plastocyanin|nr:hypothetical protein [Candidatus Saccharibacteria bacterium]